MSGAIYCDCGLVCRGDSDEELLREAERHLQDDHPGLAGRVRPQDLLAMAVEIAPERVVDPDESEGPLVVRRGGAIATVILNRPRHRNAMSLDLITRLRRELSALGDDAGVRAPPRDRRGRPAPPCGA